MKWQDLEGF